MPCARACHPICAPATFRGHDDSELSASCCKLSRFTFFVLLQEKEDMSTVCVCVCLSSPSFFSGPSRYDVIGSPCGSVTDGDIKESRRRSTLTRVGGIAPREAEGERGREGRGATKRKQEQHERTISFLISFRSCSRFALLVALPVSWPRC